MAKIKKVGRKFKVVHSITGIPVGRPNTFTKRSMAVKRARKAVCESFGKKSRKCAL